MAGARRKRLASSCQACHRRACGAHRRFLAFEAWHAMAASIIAMAAYLFVEAATLAAAAEIMCSSLISCRPLSQCAGPPVVAEQAARRRIWPWRARASSTSAYVITRRHDVRRASAARGRDWPRHVIPASRRVAKRAPPWRRRSAHIVMIERYLENSSSAQKRASESGRRTRAKEN